MPDQLHALDILANNWLIGVAGVGALAEFFADKVPWVDSAWDAIHSVVRPIGGALLSMAIIDGGDPGLQVASFLLGGGAALVAHAGKAGARHWSMPVRSRFVEYRRIDRRVCGDREICWRWRSQSGRGRDHCGPARRPLGLAGHQARRFLSDCLNPNGGKRVNPRNEGGARHGRFRKTAGRAHRARAGGAAHSSNAEGSDPSAGEKIDKVWPEHVNQALAVLHTMREPDEEMATPAIPTCGEDGRAAIGERVD